MKLLLDTQEFRRKPEGAEIAKINNRIIKNTVDITLADLAKEIIRGKTFLPATLREVDGVIKRQIDNWSSQQVIALDFDEGMTLKEALENQFINEHASFIYTTFSHTPIKNKFRIVFALDKPVYEYNHFESVIRFLFNHLPKADKACKDGVRLFFGGVDYYEVNLSNRLNLEDIVFSKRGFESDIEYKSYMSAEKPPSLTKNQQNKKMHNLISLHCLNTKDILEKNIEVLRDKLNPIPIELYNMNEVHDYLKQQDLKAFLGVSSNNFYDVFHEESNPSASIYLSNLNNGHHLYKCHSADGNFCGTIFQVVERLLKCSNVEAEDFLMEVYNISLVETELQRHMKKALDANKRLLMSPELPELYPEFHRLISPFRENLYILFDLVKDYLPAGDNPEIMFYHSVREIGKRFLMKHDSVNRRMNLFVLLCLILKYDQQDIPSKLQAQLLDRKKRNHHKYQSTVYGIPSYSYDLLRTVNDKCKNLV